MEPQTTAPVQPALPVQTIPSTPPAPSAPKWPWILGGLVLLLLVGTGGIFLGKQLDTPATAPIVASPTITTDPTANWNTYTATDSSFSFKYPSTLFIKETDKNFFVLLDNPNSPAQNAAISIDARLQGNYANYETAISTTKSNLIEIEELSITNGVRIYGMLGPGMGAGAPLTVGIFRYLDGALVAETSIHPIPEPIRIAEFDQILSTFKFISPSSSCPNGFKLFENNFFTLCQPSNMTVTSSNYTTTDVPEKNAVMVTFEDSLERIRVTTSFTGGWGGEPCTSEQITIDNMESEIVVWNKTGTAPCNSEILNLVAVVGEDGNRTGNLPIVVDYQRKADSYLDRAKFDTVIQSLKIN